MSYASTKRFRFEGAASISGPNPYSDSGGGGVSQASLEAQLAPYVRLDGTTAMTAALPVAPGGIASAVDPTTGVRFTDQTVTIEALGVEKFSVGTTDTLCDNYLQVVEGSAAFPSIYDVGSKEDGLYFTNPGVNVSVGTARKLAILPSLMIVDTDQENKGNVTLTDAKGKLTTYNLDAKNAVRADNLFPYTPFAPIVIGGLTVQDYKLDILAAGPVWIGDNTATSVLIGKNTVDTLIKGILQCEQKVATNTIEEFSLNAGVTIDSVLLKDNKVTAATVAVTTGITYDAKASPGTCLTLTGTNEVVVFDVYKGVSTTPNARRFKLTTTSNNNDCLYLEALNDNGSLKTQIMAFYHGGRILALGAPFVGNLSPTITNLSYSFANNATTGIYDSAASTMAFVTGGSTVLTLGPGGASFGRAGDNHVIAGRLRIADGTALLPGIAFSAQTNTGLFAPSNGHIALSADGKIQLDIETARTDIYNDLFNALPFGGSYGGTYFAPLNLVTALTTNALTLLNFGTAMIPQFSNFFNFTATSNGQFTYTGAIRRVIRAEATLSCSNNKNEDISFCWYLTGAPLDNTWVTADMSAAISSVQVTGLIQMLPGETLSLRVVAPSNNTLTLKTANIYCTALLPGLGLLP